MGTNAFGVGEDLLKWFQNIRGEVPFNRRDELTSTAMAALISVVERSYKYGSPVGDNDVRSFKEVILYDVEEFKQGR